MNHIHNSTEVVVCVLTTGHIVRTWLKSTIEFKSCSWMDGGGVPVIHQDVAYLGSKTLVKPVRKDYKDWNFFLGTKWTPTRGVKWSNLSWQESPWRCQHCSHTVWTRVTWTHKEYQRGAVNERDVPRRRKIEVVRYNCVFSGKKCTPRCTNLLRNAP